MELLGQRATSNRLAVTIGRPFNHIGPRQDPVFAASGFAKQIAEIEAGVRDSEVVVGNLDARREVTDVRDTVRAYQTILERGQPARAYNVSSGEAVAVGDILEMLCARASSTDSRSRGSGAGSGPTMCRCSSAIRRGFATSSDGRRRFRCLERWMTCSTSGGASSPDTADARTLDA